MGRLVALLGFAVSLTGCNAFLRAHLPGQPGDESAAKPQEEETGKPTEDNEGIPGYLIDPDRVAIQTSGGQVEITGAPGAVVGSEGLDSGVVVQVWRVPADAALAAGDWTAAQLTLEGELLATVFAAPDGSFAVAVEEFAGFLVITVSAPPHAPNIVLTRAPAGGTTGLVVPLGIETPPGLAASGFYGPVVTYTNVPPAFAFTAPTGGDDLATIGTSFPVAWVDGDADSAASIAVYAKTSATGTCTTGTLVAAGISEDDETDTLSLDTAAMEAGLYYLCATIADGVNPSLEVFSDRLVVYPAGTCTWVGDTSTDWETGTNWVGCGGGHPDTISERVLLLGQPVNHPVLSASKTIDKFAQGMGGGTLTVAAGVTLSTTDAVNTFGSSVTLIGSSPTCNTCRVMSSNDLAIVGDSTLTLGAGIRLRLGNDRRLLVGSATTSGHLVANGGATVDEWPVLQDNGQTFGVVVEGPNAGARSSVDINGLWIANTSKSEHALHLADYFHIKRLDNLKITAAGDFGPGAGQGDRYGIYLGRCADSVLDDTAWSNLKFDYFSTLNIGLHVSCTVPITVASCSGMACARDFEVDPNGVLAWPADHLTFTCLWSTAGTSAWSSASNWSNCNGRTGIPDQMDFIDIPAGGTQPLLAGTTAVRGTRGTGGGSITIAAGASLYLVAETDTIQSSLAVGGDTPGCKNCKVFTGLGIVINNGATLTLDRGVYLADNAATRAIDVGLAGTPGHLVVTGGGEPADWPVIAGSGSNQEIIRVSGVSGNLSSVDLNGLHLLPGSGQNRALLFDNYYNIVKFDNVRFSVTNAAAWTAVALRNCGNSTLAATWNGLTWSGGAFAAGNYNVNAVDGANCTAVGPITIFGSGSLYGAAYANDTSGRLVWGTTCAGTSVGGHCWYGGALGDSCATTCAGNGGADVGTYSFAGSAGTLAQCDAVQDAVFGAGTVINSALAPGDIGCVFDNLATRHRKTGAATLHGAADAGWRRACACRL